MDFVYCVIDLGRHRPFLGQASFALHKQFLQRDPIDGNRTVRTGNDHGERGAPAARTLPLQVSHMGQHVREHKEFLPGGHAPQKRERDRIYGG